MSDFHYYAANGLGWGTGPTLEDAIARMIQAVGVSESKKWIANSHKSGKPGVSFWSCRVPLPADADYRIDWFQPQVEGLTECGNKFLTYCTAKERAWCPDQQDVITRLQRRLDDSEE